MLSQVRATFRMTLLVVVMITPVIMSVIATPKAHAMIGPSELITSKDAPESVCRLILRSQEGLSVCSGTLIEKDRVVTAHHCIDGLTKPVITAECGYIGYEPSTKKRKTESSAAGNEFLTTGVYFRETAVVQNYSSDPANDQSTLKLDHALTLKPMKIADVMTEPQMLALNCWIAGFGLDKKLLGGRLLVGRLPLFELDTKGFTFTTEFESTLSVAKGYVETPTERRALISTATTNLMTSTIGTPGDSGAGVYCRESKDSATADPFLVAVVSTVAGVQDQTPQTPGKAKAIVNLWQYQMRANFIRMPSARGAP